MSMAYFETDLTKWNGTTQMATFLDQCASQDGIDLRAMFQLEGTKSPEQRLEEWFQYLVQRCNDIMAMDDTPDLVVGRIGGVPYLNRWYLIPRNPFCNAYLHQFLLPDIDEAPHDHPWRSLSFALEGDHAELHGKPESLQRRAIKKGDVTYRGLNHIHRVLLNENPNPDEHEYDIAYTLFITGPIKRQWGFWCSDEKFMPWWEFMGPDNYGGAQPVIGCGEVDGGNE